MMGLTTRQVMNTNVVVNCLWPVAISVAIRHGLAPFVCGTYNSATPCARALWNDAQDLLSQKGRLGHDSHPLTPFWPLVDELQNHGVQLQIGLLRRPLLSLHVLQLRHHALQVGIFWKLWCLRLP